MCENHNNNNNNNNNITLMMNTDLGLLHHKAWTSKSQFSWTTWTPGIS